MKLNSQLAVKSSTNHTMPVNTKATSPQFSFSTLQVTVQTGNDFVICHFHTKCLSPYSNFSQINANQPLHQLPGEHDKR